MCRRLLLYLASNLLTDDMYGGLNRRPLGSVSRSECGRLSKALDKSMEIVATSLLLSRLSFQSSTILNERRLATAISTISR